MTVFHLLQHGLNHAQNNRFKPPSYFPSYFSIYCSFATLFSTLLKLRGIILCCLLALLSQSTTMYAQQDSSAKTTFQPNPKTAGLYSAILPGLGQAYNKQYWKVPVIYGGLAVAGYFINYNYTNYQSYRKAYVGRINNPYPADQYVGIYDINQLQQLQNEYYKYLNLTVLFTTVGYTLQVVEAITGAHLKNFDISRDISLRVQPIVAPGYAGVGMALHF